MWKTVRKIQVGLQISDKLGPRVVYTDRHRDRHTVTLTDTETDTYTHRYMHTDMSKIQIGLEITDQLGPLVVCIHRQTDRHLQIHAHRHEKAWSMGSLHRQRDRQTDLKRTHTDTQQQFHRYWQRYKTKQRDYRPASSMDILHRQRDRQTDPKQDSHKYTDIHNTYINTDTQTLTGTFTDTYIQKLRSRNDGERHCRKSP